jgi:hypothetical protein
MVRLESSSPAPVALQWKLVFPKGLMVAIADIMAGSAAESAGKSLTCVALGQTQTPTFACVLAGGKQALGRGTLVMVRYRVMPGVSSIDGKVSVESVVAVTADEKKLDIPSASGVISVQ